MDPGSTLCPLDLPYTECIVAKFFVSSLANWNWLWLPDTIILDIRTKVLATHPTPYHLVVFKGEVEFVTELAGTDGPQEHKPVGCTAYPTTCRSLTLSARKSWISMPLPCSKSFSDWIKPWMAATITLYSDSPSIIACLQKRTRASV